MSNVSSSNGLEKHPKLRFKGFSEPWTTVLLRDVAEYRKKRQSVSKYEYISTENMLQHYMGITPYADSSNIEGIEYCVGDTLIGNIRPYLKKVWFATFDGACSADVLALKPNYINPEFLYDIIAQDGFIEYVMSGVKGSKMPRGDKSHILDYETALPSLAEQEKIAYFLRLLSTRIQKLQLLIDSLKKYKRGLLSAVFSRKLTFGTCTEWHETTISKCLQYEQPQKYIVETEQYDDSYSTPVLTANKAFILGYTNESTGIYEKGNVIIYDDFTMDMKYVTFPFKVKSSTIKMLTPRQGFDLYFVYALLQSLELQPEGHQRSYISKVEPMVVQVPCYEEQVKISNFLQKCDSRVHQEEETLTKLMQYKNGLFQSLFI